MKIENILWILLLHLLFDLYFCRSDSQPFSVGAFKNGETSKKIHSLLIWHWLMLCYGCMETRWQRKKYALSFFFISYSIWKMVFTLENTFFVKKNLTFRKIMTSISIHFVRIFFLNIRYILWLFLFSFIK